MNEYMQANRARWNELARLHAEDRTGFYRVQEFKQGKNKLYPFEIAEMGDVTGKTMLHLQCHFGLDTLSWARRGAIVTGIDFSDSAIELARSLAAELGITATFVCANVYDLPDALTGAFDIVYTSRGVLGWLPDLARWAKVIGHFLKPGGMFYITEAHPFAWVFDDRPGVTELCVGYPYFPRSEPIKTDAPGSYADPNAAVTHTVEYFWPHSMSEILNALIGAGLRIEFLHEFPFVAWKMLPFMEEDSDGLCRLTGQGSDLPLSFSLKATKTI